MTDQYYAQEDNLPDTPETALANWEAASNQVAKFAPQAAEDLNRTEQALGLLYQRAQDRLNALPPDDPKRPDAQAELDAAQRAWDIAQRTTQNLVQLDTTRQIAQTAVQKSSERMKKIQEELDQIYGALDEAETKGYTTHPRLISLIEALEEEEGEEFEEGLYIVDPGMEAHANGWWDCLVPEAVDMLTFALFGNIVRIVPTELREKLAEFVNGFGDEMLEVKRSRRAAFMDALSNPSGDVLGELMDEEDFDEEFDE